MKDAHKSAKSTTETDKPTEGLTEEERAPSRSGPKS